MITLLEFIEKISAMPQVTYSLRILVAVICGAILGLERAARSKDAGFRTHAIFAGGAALFMVLSKYAFFDIIKGGGLQGFDPTVIACYIIDGSGFLCAGIIFNKAYDDTIAGLTTAAGVWATAAVGMACGCGMIPLGILFTLFLLFTHWVLSRRGFSSRPVRTLRMKVENNEDLRRTLRNARDQFGVRILSAQYSQSTEDNTLSMLLKIRAEQDISFEDTLHFLDAHPEVKDISF